MCTEKTPWEKVCEFHGHVCPGLAIGFRAATLALEKLGVSRSVDEELVAMVENNACGVDAVQVLAGCTFGKGNLFFLDHGKQVYTFARRSHGKAVRVAVRYGAFFNPELSELRRKVNSGEAAGEEKREFIRLQQKHIQDILNSGEENFDIRQVDIAMPPKAGIFQSLRCEKCGESVMETRTVNAGGKVVCIPCSKVK
ncbi:MAG: TraR/DksA C4-type zinc finger protein [Peptococcaceae bacterium]|nr:TraR/DksA C4-type zinc finger protein [Peptococcaceae bacterium]